MSSSDQTGIAIFASGTGSNALKILEHFAGHPDIRVRVVITNTVSAAIRRPHFSRTSCTKGATVRP
jgi:folate-dependent phosphoribosylglycinamide formyltransferase PurN